MQLEAGSRRGERLVRTGVVKHSLLVELWLVSELCAMISLIHTFLIHQQFIEVSAGVCLPVFPSCSILRFLSNVVWLSLIRIFKVTKIFPSSLISVGGRAEASPLADTGRSCVPGEKKAGKKATLTEILAVFIDHSADTARGGTASPPPLLWSGDYWRRQWCWWLRNVENSSLRWCFPLMPACLLTLLLHRRVFSSPFKNRTIAFLSAH